MIHSIPFPSDPTADPFQDERCCHVPILFTEGGWKAKPGVPTNWPMILVSWYGANAYAAGLDSKRT